MQLGDFFLSYGHPVSLLYGEYDPPLVALSLFVALLAGIMAFQLAGMARTETRTANRQIFLFSGAFVLGSGVWSMHFIGMLAYSVCSSVRYDTTITLASMLPSFFASWIALVLIAKDKISSWQLITSGISVGAGIGVMHYSGMAAVHHTLVLRFDPVIFGVSIVVAVVLSVLALWLRFKLIAQNRFSQRQVNLLSGIVLGTAISGMHYTGMQATGFLTGTEPDLGPVSNFYLALSIAGITTLAILVTVGGSLLLRFRFLYQRMVQTEARTRTIMETAVDGIITVDSRGIIRDFNSAAEAIFGWQPSEIIGRTVDTLVPEPQRGQRESYLQSYFRSSSAQEGRSSQEIVGLRRDGTTFPLRIAIGEAALQNEKLFVGFISDISERKQMETALRKSEQQYRSLIGNLPGIAFRRYMDDQWTVLFISDAVERLTGWQPTDFTNGHKPFVELLHPDDKAVTKAKVADLLIAGQAYMIEYRIVDRAGNEHWVSESASSVRGPDGAVDWIDGVIIDITDSKRRNAEFEGVVNAIGRSLAVIEFALDGTILHANEIFLGITGYRLDELVGHHHSLLCAASEVNSESYQQFWDTLRHGAPSSGEFRRIGKHGKEIWIHGSYNPILDPDGHPYKIIKFASDLSQRHAMEQDLRDAKARAEQAAAAKNTFLANMSHEIRTPMNAIIGFTEVLLGESASDIQRKHLNTVRQSARSLLTLLDGILDMAKLERGAVELEIKDFSLRDVCMQVLATLRITAQAKSLPLILDYADSVPEFFKGDALRFQQILLNLVGNALKFTDKGQVSLSVSQHLGQVRLAVHDTGIGIAQDRIARIFDPFSQADASMSRRFGGTGLGTTIARQLIELMHGRIWVESQLGVGSHFYVEIPLAEGDAVVALPERALVALAPLNLLVVDDVPLNLEVLRLMLSRHGHTLTMAANGEEAVQVFTNGRFDIVLMDVQMPVLDGLDATRQIRRLETATGRAPTPVIALTASVLEEDARAAQAAGMDGFASKPVDLHDLMQEMARVLKIQLVPPKPAGNWIEPPLQGSVIDWLKGQQQWGTEQRHRDALRRFFVDFDDTVPRLRLLLGVPTELSNQLHRLRGASANLALPRITNLSGLMEREVAAGNMPRIPPMLDQLADEIIHASEALAELAPEAVAAQASITAIDSTRVLAVLRALDDALAHGELAEGPLATLGEILPKTSLEPLDQAINMFDFDAARQLVSALRIRFQK
jgi:two-component system sensor histidine kinase/response regulator